MLLLMLAFKIYGFILMKAVIQQNAWLRCSILSSNCLLWNSKKCLPASMLATTATVCASVFNTSRSYVKNICLSISGQKVMMHNPCKDDNSVNNCNCRFPTEMATKRQNLQTAALIFHLTLIFDYFHFISMNGFFLYNFVNNNNTHTYDLLSIILTYNPVFFLIRY